MPSIRLFVLLVATASWISRWRIVGRIRPRTIKHLTRFVQCANAAPTPVVVPSAVLAWWPFVKGRWSALNMAMGSWCGWFTIQVVLVVGIRVVLFVHPPAAATCRWSTRVILFIARAKRGPWVVASLVWSPMRWVVVITGVHIQRWCHADRRVAQWGYGAHPPPGRRGPIPAPRRPLWNGHVVCVYVGKGEQNRATQRLSRATCQWAFIIHDCCTQHALKP